MALQALTVPNPAFNGLAKQRQQVALDSSWATKAENIVIDGAGRLASRKGWAETNETAITGTPTLEQMHEYLTKAGASTIISSGSDHKLYAGITTPTDITGALTPTNDNWQFINFNGKCLGWQAGETPIVYTGTGNFTAITAGAGTLPDGNCAWAAFGRVWAVDDDKQTIRYCALLDETDWSTASGGGSIDMSSVWTQGMDEVMAITSYGSALIVFGRRHVVMWVDGSGSQIGLNPVNMYVGEVIEGIGIVARDCFALVGELDVIFWSYSGVRSLRRTLQEQPTPVNEIAAQNRDYLADSLSTGDLALARMVYAPKEGFVLLSRPDNGELFCFDTKQQLPDGGYRMTTWTLAPYSMAVTAQGVVYFGFSGGKIGLHTGWDDNGTAYTFRWNTGWALLPPDDRLKELKRCKFFIYSPGNVTMSFQWWTDFKSDLRVEQRFLEGNGDEWNVDEWSLMEWTSSYQQHEVFMPLAGICQYAKFGVVAQINGLPFAIQSFTVYVNPTRLA